MINAPALSWTPSTSSFFFSCHVHMLLWIFLNKVLLLQLRSMTCSSWTKDYKTLSTHSLISLLSKLWYQLLTMTLYILTNIGNYQQTFHAITKKIMVKTKIETTLLRFESLDLFIKFLTWQELNNMKLGFKV